MNTFTVEEVKRELASNSNYEHSDILIEDINGSFTKVKNLIVNENDLNWKEIVLNNGQTLKVTSDHPFIVNGETVYTKDLKIGDNLEDKHGEILTITNISPINTIETSYDVETESHSFVFSGIHSHNCRTYVEGDNLVEYNSNEEPKKYKFVRTHRPPYEITAGRGNFNFITLNLPKFAIESVLQTKNAKMRKKNEIAVQNEMLSKFYKFILTYSVQAKDILQIKEEIIGNKLGKNFQFVIGQNIIIGSDEIGENDQTKSIWEHFSKSIGYIGLYEAMLLLYNKDHSIDQKHGEEIVRFIRKFTDNLSKGFYILPTEKGLKEPRWWNKINDYNLSSYSKKNKEKSYWDECFQVYDMKTDEPIFLKDNPKLEATNFSLFATPAEGLCMSSRNADYKEYGKIKDITNKEYYTNSNHVWVGKDISIYDKANTEASYHAMTNAGNIFYIETDGLVKDNPKAFAQILEELHNAECGYCAINHPVDECSLCHYQGVIPEGECCPKCGANEEYIGRIRRITGYLVGTLNRFNNGKKHEVADRVKHH